MRLYIHGLPLLHTAVSAAKEAAGNIDVNQALKYKEKLDEFTATDEQESNKKDD